MIGWLTENALWLGAVGAIAAVIALFTPLFKKNKPESNNVIAENGSVASGGNMEGVTITTNNIPPKKQSNDTDN